MDLERGGIEIREFSDGYGFNHITFERKFDKKVIFRAMTNENRDLILSAAAKVLDRNPETEIIIETVE